MRDVLYTTRKLYHKVTVRGDDDPTVFLLVTVFVEVNVWRIQL